MTIGECVCITSTEMNPCSDLPGVAPLLQGIRSVSQRQSPCLAETGGLIVKRRVAARKQRAAKLPASPTSPPQQPGSAVTSPTEALVVAQPGDRIPGIAATPKAGGKSPEGSPGGQQGGDADRAGLRCRDGEARSPQGDMQLCRTTDPFEQLNDEEVSRSIGIDHHSHRNAMLCMPVMNA